MNYKNSDIVYTIVISEIGEYEMCARPVFESKQLALEYTNENDLCDVDFEICTLYYEGDEDKDEKEAEN